MRWSLGKGRRWLTHYQKLSLQPPDKQLLQSMGQDCTWTQHASSHCRNRFSGSGRMYFPLHQELAAVRQASWRLAGRRAVIWTGFCTWLIRAAVWLQVPSRGAWVVSDTCVLAFAFLALAPVDSFCAGIVPLCYLSQTTEPPQWVSVAQCHAGQRWPTDNWRQWNCGFRLPKGKSILNQIFLNTIFYVYLDRKANIGKVN